MRRAFVRGGAVPQYCQPTTGASIRPLLAAITSQQYARDSTIVSSRTARAPPELQLHLDRLDLRGAVPSPRSAVQEATLAAPVCFLFTCARALARALVSASVSPPGTPCARHGITILSAQVAAGWFFGGPGGSGGFHSPAVPLGFITSGSVWGVSSCFDRVVPQCYPGWPAARHSP